MLYKRADGKGVIGEGWDVGKELASTAREVGTDTYNVTRTGAVAMIGAAPILGVALGYLASRATSPSSTIKNADKHLMLAALDSELESSKRRLSAEGRSTVPQVRRDKFIN